VTALFALTFRMVQATLRNDLPFAILVTVGNFLFFYYALRNVIDTGGITYSQYLLPVMIVQGMFLAALTTVDRAARDQMSDFGVRLRTLSIPAVIPLLARMLYCLFRGALALLAAVAVGYAFGFRLDGGLANTLAFAALVLLLTLTLSLGADAMGVGIAGSNIAHSGASSQVLLVPQMLLIMLSTGLAPVDSFPGWLQPFVQYQPVSQLTESLRGFATGNIAAGNLATSLAWCLGMLLVFGAIALRMQRRTQ
jgi:ABC-2 type transport system permease protein